MPKFILPPQKCVELCEEKPVISSDLDTAHKARYVDPTVHRHGIR
jgi:hypothetical protein